MQTGFPLTTGIYKRCGRQQNGRDIFVGPHGAALHCEVRFSNSGNNWAATRWVGAHGWAIAQGQHHRYFMATTDNIDKLCSKSKSGWKTRMSATLPVIINGCQSVPVPAIVVVPVLPPVKPKKKCAAPSGSYKTCRGVGDPHFTTSFYTSRRFDFQGKGLFLLASDKSKKFKLQAFQCPWGRHGRATVFAGFAMNVDGQRVTIVKDKVALDGEPDKIALDRQPFGLEVLGSPSAARNVKVCSTDRKISFYTHVRRHRYSWAGLMHNLQLQISSTEFTTDGVCGSNAGRKQVMLKDSLFSRPELESLCKICGSSRICQESDLNVDRHDICHVCLPPLPSPPPFTGVPEPSKILPGDQVTSGSIPDRPSQFRKEVNKLIRTPAKNWL